MGRVCRSLRTTSLPRGTYPVRQKPRFLAASSQAPRGVRRRQSRLLDATKVAAVRHRHSQVFYSTVPPDIRPVGVERRPGFTTGDRVTDEVDRQATRARPTRKVEMDRESYGTDSGTFAARASFDVLERRLMAEPGIERVTLADP